MDPLDDDALTYSHPLPYAGIVQIRFQGFGTIVPSQPMEGTPSEIIQFKTTVTWKMKGCKYDHETERLRASGVAAVRMTYIGIIWKLAYPDSLFLLLQHQNL